MPSSFTKSEILSISLMELILNVISNLIKEKGTTEVNINLNEEDSELIFKLKNKRLIDRKSINTLKNRGKNQHY